jgi:uncharacterized protein YraI
MKIRPVVCAATMLLLIAFASESHAGARDGYSGVNLNLRSGPGARFPIVRRLAAGSALTIRGCVARYTWCDVSASGERGWASGAYIQFVHEARRVYVPAYAAQSQIPIVTFNIGNYWHDYYRDYSFYGDLDRWNEYHWEDEGNPPGWRDNWEEEPAFENEGGPDHAGGPDSETPPDDD